MDCKIDWLSFTVPANLGGAGHGEDTWMHVTRLIQSMAGSAFLSWLDGQEWNPRAGRGHYGAGLANSTNSVLVWFGGISNHLLVEITGVGCSQLRDDGLLQELIERTCDRVTRLDVAVDIEDAGSPASFIAAGYNPKFKSRGSITSPDGETEYVGSPKSDRFARVYRYAKPHPRSHLLRVETVLRAEWAKSAAHSLAASSAQALARALGDAFQWKAEEWRPDHLEVTLRRTTRGEREGSATILWLYRAVLPALRTLHQEGKFDVRKWLESEVLPNLDDNDQLVP